MAMRSVSNIAEAPAGTRPLEFEHPILEHAAIGKWAPIICNARRDAVRRVQGGRNKRRLQVGWNGVGRRGVEKAPHDWADLVLCLILVQSAEQSIDPGWRSQGLLHSRRSGCRHLSYPVSISSQPVPSWASVRRNVISKESVRSQLPLHSFKRSDFDYPSSRKRTGGCRIPSYRVGRTYNFIFKVYSCLVYSKTRNFGKSCTWSV